MKKLLFLLTAAVVAMNVSGAMHTVEKSAKDCCKESINAQPVLYDDGVISISVNAKNDNGKFSDDLNEWRVYESAEAVITIRSKGDNYLRSMSLTFNTTKDAVLMFGNDTVKSGNTVYLGEDAAYLRVKGQGNKGRVGITSFVIDYDDEIRYNQFYGVPSSDGDTLLMHYGTEWRYTANAVVQEDWQVDYFEEQREAFKVIKLMPSVKTAVPFSTKELFRGFASVTKIENLNYLDVSEVTDMRGMFRECFKLESLDLSEFNTSRVTTMSQMFTSCWNLKELDVSSFNTENVEYMVDMFCQCSRVTSLDLSKFNTEKVISMAAMFRDCKALRSIDLSSFDTKNVTNMSLMFHECESLESLDLRNFNFGKVKDVSSMFYWCASLSEIVCKVKTALANKEGLESEDMFGSCVSLVGEKGTAWDEEHTDASYARLDEAPENPGYFTSEPRKLYGKFIGEEDDRIMEVYYGSDMDVMTDYLPDEWINSDMRYTVRKVWFDESVKQARPVSLEALFSGFTSLKKFEHLDYLNTSNVKAMNGMFYNCTSLDTLDLRSFDWSNVTNTRVMFNNCENLKTIYCKQDLNETGIDESEDMFYGCKKLVGQNGTEYNPEHTDKEYAREDGGPESETPGYFTIADKEIYGVISETAFYIYYNRNKVEDEDFLSPEEWSKAPGIEAVETVYFEDDMKPTSTAEWFHGFTSLTTIEGLENLNTSEVTDMHQMFDGCESLETLDLRSFDWSKVTDVRGMFRNCANLTTIYCAEDLYYESAITSSNDMFDGCDLLVGGRGTQCNGLHKDHEYARPDGGTAKPGYFTKNDGSIYGVFTDNVFTLYYDENPEALDAVEEWWDDSYDELHEQVETIRLDESMEDALPTSTSRWFYYFPNVTSIEGLSYLNTEEVTNMYSMFAACYKLKVLDVSNFKTDKVTNMSSMFLECESLKKLDLSKWNTENVKYTGYMFSSCEDLTYLDLTHFKTDKVEDMNNMFSNCYELQTIFCSDDWNTGTVTYSEDMFAGCDVLTGEKGTLYDYNKTDVTLAHLDADGNPGYFAQSMPRTVYGTLDLSTNTLTIRYDDQMKANNGARPCEWYNSFVCSLITKVVFDESMEEANVTSTEDWFYNFINLTEIEGIGHLNTDNLREMNLMFANCESLTSLDLSELDPGGTNQMQGIFLNCSSLETIDITDWNPFYAEDMRYMFMGCSALKTITCNHDWLQETEVDPDYLDHEGMFDGCTALEGGAGTSYDTDATDGTYARPDEGTDKPGYFTSTGKPTGTEDVSSSADNEPRKVLRNGILYILRGGKTYNAQGATVK